MELIYAAQSGDIGLVKEWVKSGQSLEICDPLHWTALMRACNGGHADIVKLLISQGMDVNKQNKSTGIFESKRFAMTKIIVNSLIFLLKALELLFLFCAVLMMVAHCSLLYQAGLLCILQHSRGIQSDCTATGQWGGLYY